MIKLVINEEVQEFLMPVFLSALTFKKSLILAEKFDKDFTVDLLDEAVQFIVSDLYKDKFTVDEFWNGLDASELMTVVRDSLMSPSNRVGKELKN